MINFINLDAAKTIPRRVGRYILDLFGAEYGPMPGCCEYIILYIIL